MDTKLIEIACEEFHKKYGLYPNHIFLNGNEVEVYYETEDKK